MPDLWYKGKWSTASPTSSRSVLRGLAREVRMLGIALSGTTSNYRSVSSRFDTHLVWFVSFETHSPRSLLWVWTVTARAALSPSTKLRRNPRRWEIVQVHVSHWSEQGIAFNRKWCSYKKRNSDFMNERWWLMLRYNVRNYLWSFRANRVCKICKAVFVVTTLEFVTYRSSIYSANWRRSDFFSVRWGHDCQKSMSRAMLRTPLNWKDHEYVVAVRGWDLSLTSFSSDNILAS